jgi:hypothetical protein
MIAASSAWPEVNLHPLLLALADVRGSLQRYVACLSNGHGASGVADEDQPAQNSEGNGLSVLSLERICKVFSLSLFERDLLLLCAGIELEASFAALCVAAQGDQHPYPTFSLALAALPGAHWSALTPAAPLRRWQLITVSAGGPLTQRALRIDERVLHELVGVPYLDERLDGLVAPVGGVTQLTSSHQSLADRLAHMWRPAAGSRLPAIQLYGEEPEAKRSVAAAVCLARGLQLRVLSAELLPKQSDELAAFVRLWEREAALSGSAILLDCHGLEDHDITQSSAIMRFIECLRGAIIIGTREQLKTRRPLIAAEVHGLRSGEQRAIWQAALGVATHQLNGQLDRLVGQFSFSQHEILAASSGVIDRFNDQHTDNLSAALWDACRERARPRLDNLAQRIETTATWDDLVLPEQQLRVLNDITAHVRQRAKVYEQWGFAAKGARGLGISALFAGASGTGKTMAAEVLANELHLDLYRIDLSAVVSKYIGETEKNLRRLFDAAEGGGAILLFDEADTLFGKRSEVKDSHDRYANIEVSYLLQRMETYRGLAILTTNLKHALDTAFLRRIRFVVQFPFPDTAQRAMIWRRIFPRATPTEALEVERLAQLNITGGNIRNIALNAAFLAADADEPVRMAHLLRAARGEYTRLEKPLTEAEIAGWA